jgi:hypothetical protein
MRPVRPVFLEWQQQQQQQKETQSNKYERRKLNFVDQPLPALQ